MLRRLILLVIGCGLLCADRIAAQNQPEETPDAPTGVPLIDTGAANITNILLLGSDTSHPTNAGRTDVMLVVSVNRTAGTVALLSLPRDLYVHIPGWQTNKLNTAFGYGGRSDYEGGGGQLLKDTIEYNFGIVIDYYARVNFDNFRTIVDQVGGIELSVDCAIEDWRLIEPDLDPTLEENWELFTLPVGVHQMDGDLALWYVRSRRTSSDIDRGRRQQAVVRALWQRVVALDLPDQLSDIWGQVNEYVETDIPLGDLLDFVPLALTIDSSHIAAYTLRINQEITLGRSFDGMSILVPQPDAMAAMMQQFLTPPTQSQLVRERPSVEIVNASGFSDLAQVAADRLALEGFVPQITPEMAPTRELTLLYDFTGQTKGSSLATLQDALRLRDDRVVSEPAANRTVDFRVILGTSYESCTYGVIQPDPPLTTEGEADESVIDFSF